MTPRCGDCRYGEKALGETDSVFECHRRAPVPLANLPEHDRYPWPLLDAEDWCGEFEINAVAKGDMAAGSLAQRVEAALTMCRVARVGIFAHDVDALLLALRRLEDGKRLSPRRVQHTEALVRRVEQSEPKKPRL